MAFGDKKSFVLTQGGVSAEVWLEDMGPGQTQVSITSLKGTLDINALFWDLGAAGDNSLTGVAGLTNSMNMNGVGSPGGIQWDDAKVVSLPGSHTAQIGVGEGLAPIFIDANWADIGAFGIRAGGNKMADTSVNETVLAPHLEVVKVLDFEQDDVDGGFMGLFTQTVPIDWNSAGNLPVEIQGGLSGYGGHTNYGAAAPGTAFAGNPLEDQYLDTAQSSGNIFLRTEHFSGVDVTTGAKAHIDISVAPQYLTYPGNGQHYETSPDSSFDLVFNGQTVHTFTLADFENGVTDQTFKNFSYDKDALGNDLVGVAGDDFIAIMSNGEQQNYTGFSVDHVVLQEWHI
jgi:hypothetical protein